MFSPRCQRKSPRIVVLKQSLAKIEQSSYSDRSNKWTVKEEKFRKYFSIFFQGIFFFQTALAEFWAIRRHSAYTYLKFAQVLTTIGLQSLMKLRNFVTVLIGQC